MLRFLPTTKRARYKPWVLRLLWWQYIVTDDLLGSRSTSFQSSARRKWTLFTLPISSCSGATDVDCFADWFSNPTNSRVHVGVVDFAWRVAIASSEKRANLKLQERPSFTVCCVDRVVFQVSKQERVFFFFFLENVSHISRGSFRAAMILWRSDWDLTTIHFIIGNINNCCWFRMGQGALVTTIYSVERKHHSWRRYCWLNAKPPWTDYFISKPQEAYWDLVHCTNSRYISVAGKQKSMRNRSL